MWRVVLARAAVRGLSRAGPADRLRLETALISMQGDPFGGDVRRLAGRRRLFRRRIGDWRVIFAVSTGPRTVYVQSIVRRTSTTY